MPISGRRDLLLIGGICLPFAVTGWVLYGPLLRLAPAQDFMVFYTAARAYFDGHLPILYDGDAFTAQLNHRFADWLARPLDLHAWIYPPPFLLMIIPFGILPFAVSYGVFMVITFVFLNRAIRCYAPAGYQRWVIAISLLLSPATAWTVVVGQNGFMTTALLVGGMGLMPRAPLLAGVLLGLLACKPQLWLMVPVALIAAGQWRVLGSAVATLALLALASVAVLGIAPWRAWLALLLEPNPLYQRWLRLGRLNGQSVYADAVLLGAPAEIASAIQVFVTLLCAALVWWCFRISGMRRDLQLALLLTATILAAPHVANYDAVMVTVAVSIFLCRALEDGFRFGDAIVIVVVWSSELLDPPAIIHWGLLTPPILSVFLAAVIARGRSAYVARLSFP